MKVNKYLQDYCALITAKQTVVCKGSFKSYINSCSSKHNFIVYLRNKFTLSSERKCKEMMRYSGLCIVPFFLATIVSGELKITSKKTSSSLLNWTNAIDNEWSSRPHQLNRNWSHSRRFLTTTSDSYEHEENRNACLRLF